jgi:type I restriction enzyme S subunit
MAKKKETLASPFVPAEEQPYPIPENWCWIHLLDSFENHTDSKKKVQSKTYLENGELAVVDQGQELIGGYTDDENMTYSGKLPVIVFGDHTRCIKYIDFPFAQGADGVKVLLPKSFYDVRAFYFALQSIDIPNMGYRRHYPLFPQFCIPVPPLHEQHRIVSRIESLFAKLDEAKEKAQAVVDGFELRKSAILHKAFTGELTERWRKEHGVWLDSWEVIPLGNLILSGPQNGLYKPKDAYGSGTKILRIDGFYDGYVEAWETLKRLTLSVTEIKLYELHLDEIVINRVNSMPYLGKSALIRELPETCVFESNMMRISLNKERIIPEFMIRYLNSQVGLAELRKNAKQAVNQASINQKDVKSVIVKLPFLDEQEEIVRILDSLLTREQQAKEAAEAVLAQIDTMKKAILARAFRGELGTNDPAEEWAGELVKER